jgi:hypothetical protein
VEYVALSGDSGTVQGRVLTVRPQGQPPAETAVGRTEAVRGRLSSTRVELSFGGARARGGARMGTASFMLEQTGGRGHPAPLVFHRASPAAFDAAVADLDGEVRRANRSADQQQAIDDAGSLVAADLGAVNSATEQTATAVGAIAPEITTTMDDLAAAAAQQAQVGADVSSAGDPTSVGAIDACSDAALVGDDAGDVVSDAEVVGADAVGVQDGVDQMRRLADVLGADTATLSRRENALRSYRPSSLPSVTAAVQARAAASTAVAGDVAGVNRDIAVVNRAVRQADADAVAAAGLISCGPPSPPPTVTEPPIS